MHFVTVYKALQLNSKIWQRWKTFKGVIDFNPYDVEIKKLECVSHVKKGMGSRLRREKKKHKGVGGKGPGKLPIS